MYCQNGKEFYKGWLIGKNYIPDERDNKYTHKLDTYIATANFRDGKFQLKAKTKNELKKMIVAKNNEIFK